MKPVFQTTFGGPKAPIEERGNCFSACVASILELPIEQVPTFVIEDDWHIAAQTWLNARGLWLLSLPWDDEWGAIVLEPFGGYHIIGGQSPRGEHGHSVVGLRGEIVHDPHPSGEGIRPPNAEFPWELSVLISRFE